jgi:hypothetical protein
VIVTRPFDASTSATRLKSLNQSAPDSQLSPSSATAGTSSGPTWEMILRLRNDVDDPARKGGTYAVKHSEQVRQGLHNTIVPDQANITASTVPPSADILVQRFLTDGAPHSDPCLPLRCDRVKQIRAGTRMVGVFSAA